MSERISKEQLIDIYKVEISFINELEDSGLINTYIENEVTYLLHDDLADFERFANFYYDLEINIPGIEVIQQLLQRLEDARQENRKLRDGLFQLRGDWQDES